MNLNKWDKGEYNNYIKYLISLKEDDYKEFSKKLINTKYEMLGIRLPKLRSIAKEILKGNYQEYLKYNNPIYYEEVMIKGFVIAYSKEESILEKHLYEQIDNIDNWSLCDSFCKSLKLIIIRKRKIL